MIKRRLAAHPFKAHSLFSGGHQQTFVGNIWPRRFPEHQADERRLFEVEPGVRVLAHCRWQNNSSSPDARAHPTMILVHGLEGSSSSIYMLGTAHKAYQAGFNVVRLNMRNCGGTEHLTPTLYHSGMSADLYAVAQQLIEVDKLTSLFFVGFSLGGNLALKFFGEHGARLPKELRGVAAVSPSLDLSSCSDRISERSNWVYQRRFLRSFARRMRHKAKLYPDIYRTNELRRIRTIRDFDEHYTAVHGGFSSAADYYQQASALPLIKHIQQPTLIIHAQDDPFIPLEAFLHPSITENPHVALLLTSRGGHVGFVANNSGPSRGEDRFWAENRVVEFCQLVDQA